MIIRKYIVDNINEALFRIKHELGTDAYIISQKMIRQPGVKGFFSNKKLEVTVGLVDKDDNQEEVKKEFVAKENQAMNNKESYVSNHQTNEQVANTYSQNNKSMSYYNKLFEEKQKSFNLDEDSYNKNNVSNWSMYSKVNNENNLFNVENQNTYKVFNNQDNINLNHKSDTLKSSNTLLNTNNDILTHNTLVNDNVNNNGFANSNNNVSNNGFINSNTSLNHNHIGNNDENKKYNENNILNMNSRYTSKPDVVDSSNKLYTSKEITNIDIDDDIKKELKEIKTIVRGIANDSNSMNYLNKMLENLDICKELSEEIKMNCKLTYEEIKDKRFVKDYLRNIFSNIIHTYEDDISDKFIVIGPTGAGKTTTVAKLAGMISLNSNKKIGLVSLDTSTSRNLEDLKIYADVLKVPYKLVNNLNDIREVFREMRNCDVILVDTVGKSNKNIVQINELNMLVQSMESDGVSLVISAGMKQKDIDLFMESFKGVKFKNVIVTKLDETNNFGVFVNISYKTSLPISFITNGQDVPVDIRRINKKEILDMILGDKF